MNSEYISTRSKYIINCKRCPTNDIFEVEVFPVKILEAGATDHKYINWLSCKGISDYHHAPLFSDDWYNIFEKYLKLGKYGRQNMALLPVELYFEIKNGTSYLNEEKLDRL